MEFVRSDDGLAEAMGESKVLETAGAERESL
jgi:hypothetical protein